MQNDRQGNLDDALLVQAVGVFETSLIIVDVVAADMPIVFANEAFAALTGYRTEEAIGRNCRFLQDGHNDQPGVDILRRAIERGEVGRAIIRNCRKDGTPFLNDVKISPLRNEHGSVTHFVGSQSKLPFERLAALRNEAHDRIQCLTKRERQVLCMLVDGHSTKAVALALSISPRTVEKHRQRMMHKMGTSNIAALTRLALAAEIEFEE